MSGGRKQCLCACMCILQPGLEESQKAVCQLDHGAKHFWFRFWGFFCWFFFFFFNHIELKYLEKPFVLSLSNESFALLKQEEKKKKTHTDHSYFSSWGMHVCTLTSEYIFRWLSWRRRYDGFVLSYKSQLWQYNEKNL